MLTLRKSNWVVRFAYLFEGGPPYYAKSINICNLFWRIVVRLLLLATFGTALGFYGYNWITNFWATAKMTGIIVALFSVVGTIFTVDAWGPQITPRKVKDAGRLAYRAVKDNFCPVITLED